MSLEIKVGNYWIGRKIHLKLCLIVQKSCNLLPEIEKNMNKCGRWKGQNRAVVTL